MPNEDVQATEILFSRGTLMDLYIGKPTFQKKLRPRDVLLEGINEDAIYLGHKKLLPKAAMETLVTLEGQARSALADKSLEFPISGARFVNYTALPGILQHLNALKEDWNEAVQALIRDYPRLREQQLQVLDKQCEDLKQGVLESLTLEQRAKRSVELLEWLDAQRDINRKLYPPVEDLPKMFHFTWRMFRVGALEAAQVLTDDELQSAQRQLREEMQEWVRNATRDMHQALGDAARQARELLEKQKKLHPRNLRPLFEAFETFMAIDFTGASNWRQQVEEARERFIRRNAQGEIDYEATASAISATGAAASQFRQLLDSIGTLAVEETAAEAGLTALTSVGEFRRLIEV